MLIGLNDYTEELHSAFTRNDELYEEQPMDNGNGFANHKELFLNKYEVIIGRPKLAGY